MICRDFLATVVPNFHNSLDDPDVSRRPYICKDSWRFIHKAPDGRDFVGAVLHHSGTLKADNPGAIATWQYNKHGWPISYHWLITKTGIVYHCKDPVIRSPHCGDTQGNRRMVAICVEGNFTVEEPTAVQVEQILRLLDGLERWKGASFGITPHKAISDTACPGILMDRLALYGYKRMYEGLKYSELPQTKATRRRVGILHKIQRRLKGGL